MDCTNGVDVGIAVSYAANGYMRHGWAADPNLMRGPMMSYYVDWMGQTASTMSQTQVTNVAATILLADRWSSTMQENKGDGGEDYAGNASGRLFGAAFIWTGTGPRLQRGGARWTGAWSTAAPAAPSSRARRAA